ncbi:hypothetical protein [Stenotrophomonas maltophilia]
MSMRPNLVALALRLSAVALSLWLACQAVRYATGGLFIPGYDTFIDLMLRLSEDTTARPELGFIQALPRHMIGLVRVPVGSMLVLLLAHYVLSIADDCALRVQHGARAYRLVQRLRGQDVKKPARKPPSPVRPITFIDQLNYLPVSLAAVGLVAMLALAGYRSATHLLAAIGMTWSSLGVTIVVLLAALVAAAAMRMCLFAFLQFRGSGRSTSGHRPVQVPSP